MLVAIFSLILTSHDRPDGASLQVIFIQFEFVFEPRLASFKPARTKNGIDRDQKYPRLQLAIQTFRSVLG